MEKRWQIISALTALGSIAFISGVLLTPPATGYEISIYAAYPQWVWFGFGLALVGGLGLMFRSILSDQPGWWHGIATVGSVYIVFFALPLFRGYYIYGTPLADSFYHFGVVRDVLETGTVPEISYPATHLLYTTLVTVTGIPMHELQPIVVFCSFLLFVGSCFLVGNAFFGRRGGLATLSTAVPLVFVSNHFSTLPWLFSLPYLVLSLYFVHRWTRRQQSGRTGLFGAMMVCGIALVFYHPVTALVTVLALALYTVVVAAPSRPRWLRMDRNRNPTNDLRVVASPYRYPIILVIAGVLWYLSIDHIVRFLEQTLTRDIDGGAASYAGAAQQTSYSAGELLWEFLVLQWGTVLVYAGVGTLISIVIVIRFLRDRNTGIESISVVQFAAGIGVACFFIGAQILSRNIVRINNYTVIGAILLFGLAITELVTYRNEVDGRWKRLGSTAALTGLCATVIVVAVLAGAVAYEDHRHVTHATMAGAEWQHENHQSGIDTQAFRMSENLQRYFEGTTRADPDEQQFHRSVEGYQLPTRLGYDEHETVDEVYDNETYLVTKRSDVEWADDRPADRRTEIHHYTAADLEQLEADSAANRVYSNGYLEVWLVEPDANRNRVSAGD